MGGMTGAEWKRVGAHIVQRRIELGMKTTKSLAERTGLTPRMLGDIENARRTNYSAGTIAQIELALKWRPGSITDILAGGEPSPVEELEAAPGRRYGFRARSELAGGPDLATVEQLLRTAVAFADLVERLHDAELSARWKQLDQAITKTAVEQLSDTGKQTQWLLDQLAQRMADLPPDCDRPGGAASPAGSSDDVESGLADRFRRWRAGIPHIEDRDEGT